MIEAALTLLAQAPYEINVDGNKGTLYPTLERAVAAARKAEADPKTRSVYFVFNPIDADRRAEYVKAEKAKGRKSPRTRDEHIVRRDWVVLDFDPVRPKGVNATDAEKKKALKVSTDVDEFLGRFGFPEPIEVSSGNGYHLYYPADLANDERTKQAVKRFTDFLSLGFSTAEVIVDRTVYKAAQLMRLPGTTNRKSPHTVDRPQRVARFDLPVDRPESRPLTLSDLENVAPPVEPDRPRRPNEADAEDILDVFKYGDDVGLEFIECDPIDRISSEGDGYTVYPVVCPFDPSHKRGEAALTLGTNGAIGFQCKHHSCIDKNWAALTELVGPPTYEHYPHPSADEEFSPIEADELNEVTIFDAPARADRGPLLRYANQIKERAGQPLRAPLIEGLIRAGDIINIIAAPKTGKTWLSIGLALSIARGDDWLGFKCHKGRVLIVDNELYGSDFDFRLNKIAEARGIDLDEIGDRLAVESLRDRGELRDLNQMALYFKAIPKGFYSLIILDAFYRFLPPKVSENDNADISRLYNLLSQYAIQTGAAIALVHHTSKGGQGDKVTTDVGSGAGVMSRAADCHFIIRQHEVDQLAVIDAATRTFEPVKAFSIKWDWPLWTKSEEAVALKSSDNRNDSRQAKLDSDGLRLILDELKRAEGHLTEGDIRSLTGFGLPRIKRLLQKAIECDDLVVKDVVKTPKGSMQRVVGLPGPEDLF